MDMKIQEIALNRLVKLSKELREKFPFIIGLKLSGSIAENNFFLLQFGDNSFVASDCDVVVLVNKYPEEKELTAVREILRKNVSGTLLEELLIQLLDIKVFTTKFPFEGEGIKVPNVYSGSLSVKRHLYQGKVIFGEDHFKKFEVKDRETLNRLVARVVDRKRIFDLFTDLGALIRIVKILKVRDVEKEILNIVSRYRNYHILTDKEIEKFKEEVEEIKSKISFFI